jgi:predicted kinase
LQKTENRKQKTLFVVLICGLMATGKTNRAKALAAAMGWPALHSDAVRKGLAGLKPTDRVPEAFGGGIYSQAFSEKTYAEMRRQAAQYLAQGQSVILDGSFKRAGERRLVQEMARQHGARAVLVFCTCSAEEVRARLVRRQINTQAISDGRLELVAAQAEDFDPLTEADRPVLRLNTQRPQEVVLAELVDFVQEQLAAAQGRTHES